ncbi:MAG TPA: MBOAT family O-acyltransferase [Candidatus Binataceae bacterium]|nr:MBOAT family O-acyltransferase [Candidatus Binataceae bacterium]
MGPSGSAGRSARIIVLFNSYAFTFGFMPIALIVFGLLARSGHLRATAAFTIVASLFFYGWWNWHYLFLFGFSVGFNYLWSLLLRPATAAEAAAGARSPRIRRVLFGIGVAVNLALLGYFKYRNFLVSSAGVILGTHWILPPLVLPLAVSFFTFEQITYLSAALGGEPGTGDFISYGMFIAFFPHLIAGPIVRYNQIYPQFNRDTRFALTAANLSDGLMIFAIGLFKKVIIADTFRNIVDPLFAHPGPIAFGDAWGAALGFALQIYFDFSGYTDMAIGLARMFGVVFPENFDSPYKARDLVHFWRTWHMTLSFFLRDYLYIPLGGNRRGVLRHYINLMITMVLGGLWHGANWTFVMWGTLHGLGLALNHARRKAAWKLPDAAAWALTFVFVTIAWVFFRAESFREAAFFLRGMAGLAGSAGLVHRYSIGFHEFERIAIALGIVLFCPNRQAIMNFNWRNDYLYAGAFAILMAAATMTMANPPPFIYFQF